MSTTVVKEEIVREGAGVMAPILGKGPLPGDGTWLEDDDTYYYKLNRKNMRYHCEHERHLLRRNLYSKRELDMFFEELYMYDLPKKHKICGILMLVLGLFILAGCLLFYLLAWRDNKDKGSIKDWGILWWILFVFFLILGLVLTCLGCYYLYQRSKNKMLRRKRLTPIINEENRRIAPRGLNWHFYDEHLALRTNYWNSRLGKAGYIKKTKKKRKTKKVVTETVTKDLSPRSRNVTVVESTHSRPIAPVVQETVVSRSGSRYTNSRIG